MRISDWSSDVCSSDLIDRRKGFTKNLGPGGDTDDAHMDAFRVSVRFQPTDWIRNDLVFDHTRIDTNAQGFYPFQVINPQLNAAVDELRSQGKSTFRTSNQPFDKEQSWAVCNTTTSTFRSCNMKEI